MTPLVEAGQAQHVLGHPLAPLATGVRAGQRLAQALGGAGQGLGDLGVDLQRPIDLAEALAGGLAELLDERAEPLDVGLDARLHLAQPLVDDLLAGCQAGVVGLRGGAQLLASHGDGLLDSRLDARSRSCDARSLACDTAMDTAWEMSCWGTSGAATGSAGH